jgi:ComF family protein
VGRRADLFLGRSCVICGSPAEALCARCVSAIERPPALALPPGLVTLTSLFRYDGHGRQLITAFKYGGHHSLAAPLGRALAAVWAQVGGDTRAAIVTWAPTTHARRRARGYDQAESLARVVSAASGQPLQRLLRRRPGAHQTGHDAAQRAIGPVFDTIAGRVPPVVVVVDDVRTTGATLSAAAEALAHAGCRSVHGLVVASTPLPSAETL